MRMRRKIRWMLMTLALPVTIGVATAFGGCDRQEGTLEEAGEAVDDAAEESKEKLDEAAEAVDDEVEDAKKEVDEAVGN